MLTVALTGGIATGKTHVQRWFASQGVPTIAADDVARDVVRPRTPAWHAIRTRFGASVFAPDGTIDRPALARIVFVDAAARHDLEAIVHPPVYAAVDRWRSDVAAAGTVPVAIADIPLLFETGHAAQFDRVIVTTCTVAAQIARLSERDGLDEDAARQRIAAQESSASKARRADYVIDTNGPIASTDRQAADVLRRLRAEALQAD